MPASSAGPSPLVELLQKLDLSTALTRSVQIEPEHIKELETLSPNSQAWPCATELLQKRSFKSIFALLDLVAALDSKSLVYTLLEDLVEVCCLDDTPRIWPYFTTRREMLTKDINAVKPPGTTLVRVTKTFISKLSPLLHAELIAKVHLYMITSLGLHARPLANFSSTEGYGVVGAPMYNKNSQDKRYIAFWSLYTQLAKPSEHISDAEIKKLVDLLEEVPRFFADELRQNTDSSLGSGLALCLCDESLFELQLVSAPVAGAYALRVLTFIEFLLSQTATEQQIAQRTGHSLSNKSFSFDELVSAASVEMLQKPKRMWQSLFSRAYKAYPNAKSVFIEFLASERSWVLWKRDGCPQVFTPTPPTEPKELIEPNRPKGKQSMGTVQLSQLWEVETGIERFATPPSEPVPREIHEKLASTEPPPDVRDALSLTALRMVRNQGHWGDLQRMSAASLEGVFLKRSAEDVQETVKRRRIETP